MQCQRNQWMQPQLLAGLDIGLTEAADFAGIGTLSVALGWGRADATSSTNPDDYAKPGTIVFVEGPSAGTMMVIQ